ncbi:MAG: hypothetical protein WC734_00340 [Patescibacteria group bacterium]
MWQFGVAVLLVLLFLYNLIVQTICILLLLTLYGLYQLIKTPGRILSLVRLLLIRHPRVIRVA